LKALGTQTTLAPSQDLFAGVNEKFLLPTKLMLYSLMEVSTNHAPHQESIIGQRKESKMLSLNVSFSWLRTSNYSPGEVEDTMAFHMLKYAPSSSSNGRISTHEVF
jgi:hypothetical protein